jgi:hypothetical protein
MYAAYTPEQPLFANKLVLERGDQPLVLQPPMSQCYLSIAIPVRNEADNIQQTLKSLAFQFDYKGKLISHSRYEVLLLANNCQDETVSLAHDFAKAHPTFSLHVVECQLPPVEAYVGRARQLILDEAYRRMNALEAIPMAGYSFYPGRIVATTDGDTQVDRHWVSAICREMGSGIEAVSGRIYMCRQDLSGLSRQARRYYFQQLSYDYLSAKLEYALDPAVGECERRHHHHGGASLAATVKAYRRCGGLPATRSPEDVAFYHALQRVDTVFHHSPWVRVTTSGRQQGRTDIGYANRLNEWTQMAGEPLWVESAAALLARFKGRNQLRRLWQQYGCEFTSESAYDFDCVIDKLAHQLGCSRYLLQQLLSKGLPFGTLAEKVLLCQSDRLQQQWPLEPIELVIPALRSHLRSYRKRQSVSTLPIANAAAVTQAA